MNIFPHAYFSYILIRIKGSSSCSRALNPGDFVSVPNLRREAETGCVIFPRGGLIRDTIRQRHDTGLIAACGQSGEQWDKIHRAMDIHVKFGISDNGHKAMI